MSSESDLDNFPAGYTPKEIGTLISKRFIPGKHMFIKRMEGMVFIMQKSVPGTEP